ncbi:MAG: hypothetical protein KA369_08080 [Spirochaetes bacterium]|nr:hypothetical protein [Spirochaetota bacterium]
MASHQYRWIIFIIVFLLASVYFFIFSKSGLLERIVLSKEKDRISATIETLKSENAGLQRLLNKYRGGDYPEADMTDSGFVKNGGAILFFHGIETKSRSGYEEDVSAVEYPVPLPYMRIAWIILSSIIIVALILYGKRSSGQSS